VFYRSKLHLGSYEVCLEFQVVDSVGDDVVMGVQWFKTLGEFIWTRLAVDEIRIRGMWRKWKQAHFHKQNNIKTF
jgi:hypothetical protein